MNPWLSIPASDYEGHMGSPGVYQLSFLSRTFREALELHDCGSVALLGCATGNGLEHVTGLTTRLTAVDINPDYLAVLRTRYANRISGLEIVHGDLETCELEMRAYSLVFAGLVFEYVPPSTLLPRIAGWLGKGGILVAVLQLPCGSGVVSESPYASLRSLEPVMELVDPGEFAAIAADAGLTVIDARTVSLGTEKSFHVGAYGLSNP